MLPESDKLRVFEWMLQSRFSDLREQSLIRQGQGWFHVSGMGHEALAAVGLCLQDGDLFCGYYRDRAIALARGIDLDDLALAFFAKQAAASAGRQMPAHFSNRQRGIFSIASVVAASLLPATGFAWGLQLDARRNAVLTTIGDAGTRQGDFYEAVAFALEKQLPVVFLVEDNGIGISTPTRDTNPLALGVLNAANWQSVDACDPDAVFAAVDAAMHKARNGHGPAFLWCHTERISSHSSADDHRKYRPAADLQSAAANDPIERMQRQLIAGGLLSDSAAAALRERVDAAVRDAYARAAEAIDPDPAELLKHVYGPVIKPPPLQLDLPTDKCRMVDAINATLKAALQASRDCLLFGQDIEDPKGGVFSLTKGLSTAFPENVFNAPLAESTIVGTAVGLAAMGKRPIFEIQFADFLWPAFNQLVTHLSTLHWRSYGEWAAPAVIYAPYGAYLPGGALWHSQTNEAAIAHFPGIHIAIPSTPEDAAGLFWSAIHNTSPTVILVPKHLLWTPHPLAAQPHPIPLGKARFVQTGTAITLIAWGNTVEIAQQAAQRFPDGLVELIDLRSIVPIDWQSLQASVLKTRRMVIAQEDARFCSVGTSILSHFTGSQPLFDALDAAPVLLAKPDVHIGYNPVLEFAALPSVDQVEAALRDTLSHQCNAALLRTPQPPVSTEVSPSASMLGDAFSTSRDTAPSAAEHITVPMLGEGISHARVIALLANAGDAFHQDDPLCEVETDKALFPIEAPFDATLCEWLIAPGDEVAVGQPIAVVSRPDAHATPPCHEAEARPCAQLACAQRLSKGGLSPRILDNIKGVVPAHMTVMANWQAISAARRAAKARADHNPVPSPTAMVAFAICAAIRQHPVFSCTQSLSGDLQPNPHFDFGIAVALDDDALETAVIPDAGALDWPAFCRAYSAAISAVRDAKATPSKARVPLILTSMGGFHVRDAQPLVVPPAIATLFLGEAQFRNTSADTVAEQVSLCLSFDHRWINGAAGAQFLRSVKNAMEAFTAD